MSEIYWITRLDDISFFFSFISIVCGVLSGLALFFLVVGLGEDDDTIFHPFINFLKFSIPSCLLTMAINVFIPTTKDALMIFGVGGTIDYIKSNKTINQLPDKCINALDAWVESLTENESKNEN
jgi:hypothetical protein